MQSTQFSSQAGQHFYACNSVITNARWFVHSRTTTSTYKRCFTPPCLFLIFYVSWDTTYFVSHWWAVAYIGTSSIPAYPSLYGRISGHRVSCVRISRKIQLFWNPEHPASQVSSISGTISFYSCRYRCRKTPTYLQSLGSQSAFSLFNPLPPAHTQPVFMTLINSIIRLIVVNIPSCIYTHQWTVCTLKAIFRHHSPLIVVSEIITIRRRITTKNNQIIMVSCPNYCPNFRCCWYFLIFHIS